MIVAASGRALAASARRAGYLPLVADFFGDEDTVALAHAHVRLESGLVRGMDTHVLGALDDLAGSANPIGIVYGTGFEDRPVLLAEMARRWRLFGNSPETVARVKDPLAFADMCRGCGIPHPEVVLTEPEQPAEWLVKRRGGAGGIHVRPALRRQHSNGEIYFQRRLDGMPVSALVLANGRDGVVQGLSSQWSAPLKNHPYRYGGAIRPADLGAAAAAALTDAAIRLARAAALVGLNSVDFLVNGDEFWLLEINPRPGATLDVFEPKDTSLLDTSLFALHMAACDGELAAEPQVLHGATAAAIVYAGHDIRSVPALDWPDWTADRQSAGTSVAAEQPLCTVLASAPTAAMARALLDQRIATLLASTNAWVS